MNYKSILAAIVLSASFSCVTSCSEEDLSPESVIVVKQTNDTSFDLWLKENFLKPYNIQFKYRFEQNEADMNYYTVPAKLRDAIKMAHIVKHLCVETYNEVAGEDFTKSNFPKMFFLIGEWEYNNNGTFILGTAEGGKKIMLSGLNYLTQHLWNADELNDYYIRTIHHEFTHILNQTVPYQTDFKLVTDKGYVVDNWSSEPYESEYLQNGFVSAYAQKTHEEDFAETLSLYVTNTPEWWDALLAVPGCNAAAIRAKLDYVRDYMEDSWGVDIDLLRSVIIRRQSEIIDGKVSLDDITLNN